MLRNRALLRSIAFAIQICKRMFIQYPANLVGILVIKV
jgi:hypothetical protein